MLFILCLAFSIQAKEQDEYTISWSDMSTETYTLASDKGPVFRGDGAEYTFKVTGHPANAEFKWTISPSGGIETKAGDTFKWQAPMSGSQYSVKVEGWVPRAGEGGGTLKGKWEDALKVPFLDIF